MMHIVTILHHNVSCLDVLLHSYLSIVNCKSTKVVSTITRVIFTQIVVQCIKSNSNNNNKGDAWEQEQALFQLQWLQPKV